MDRKQRSERIKQLRENGYKNVPNILYLYLNQHGKVYSLQKDKELEPTSKNFVLIDNKYLNVAKLMLFTFRKEPLRNNQHICYIDNDKTNLKLENIKYIRKFKSGLKSNINIEDLYIAIRCYFEVPRKYNVRDHVLTRMYLTEILRIRGFYIDNYLKIGIEIFKSYMQGFTNNSTSVAKKYNMSICDCKYIVNGFINQLSTNILTDLHAGILQIKDYQPRPKTKTQELRELNKYFISKGVEPVRLRRKSNKELLKEYEMKCDKYLNRLENECKNIDS